MWHEARKQERIIRGMIVDYRRRAERRKDFYEKIKAEPTQFLQLHGRPCKIHLDPAIASAGEGPAIMMPWQGDTNNMIDRFDVRAHLDYISEVKNPYVRPEELTQEERQCNYESYRILAQNVFLGISEDKFLQQLAIEEQFGVTIEEKEMQKDKMNEKKGTGVAIGYNYNETSSTPQQSSSNGPQAKKLEQIDSDDDDSDLEIIDVDLSIDVNKMEPSQAHELNAVGPQFGMAGCDLFSFLTGDADDAEHQKQVMREEKEKAMFSGRKSRRERRAHRDKKLATRVMSPPSYAAPSSKPVRSPTRSPSRSPTPETTEKIQFITSFGGDEDDINTTSPSKPLYSEKLKHNLKKVALYSEIARKKRTRSNKVTQRSRPMGPHRPDSRSPSRSKSRSKSRSRSRSRKRSVSRSRVHSFTRSRFRSRSRSRVRSNSRSRIRSHSRNRSRSRSLARSCSRSRDAFRRSKSRSPSRRRQSKSPARRGAGSYMKRNKSRSLSYDSNRGGANRPAVPRYYGRRKEDKSSSELSLDSDASHSDEEKNKSAVGNKPNANQNQLRLSGSSGSKGPSRETISLKEKLKRKMQAQLSRQLRADKRAEAERLERESRRQARRDEEMRELAIKLRRKQREMRHQQNRRSSNDDSDNSGTRSSSRGSPQPDKMRENRSRSKSPSPQKNRIPVWETNREPIVLQQNIEFGENSHNQDTKRHRYVESTYSKDVSGNDDEKYNRYPESTHHKDIASSKYDERHNKYPENTRYKDISSGKNDERLNNRHEKNRYEKSHHDIREERSDTKFGGFRGNRFPGPDKHGERSQWSRNKDRDDPGNKVKLVDY